MGCNVSKYTLNDELDVKECNLSISSSYCNNNNNDDCGINNNNNNYHKYIDELEQTIVHYITHNNKKTKLSIDDEKKVMEKIKKILKELRDISKLEESKIDTMITYDKKILVLVNLFRKNFTTLYYKMEDDINKTILLLNEREIFTDMTDDELSPEASVHYETNTESEDHNDNIPPPPPKTPRCTKSYKKAP